MRIVEVAELLKAEICTQSYSTDIDIKSACSADLMSDVMAFSKESAILLTGLVNPQVIRTAEMMDIKVVIFVRGKKPQHSMVELAEEKGIVLLATNYPLFIASGKLYESGIHGCGE